MLFIRVRPLGSDKVLDLTRADPSLTNYGSPTSRDRTHVSCVATWIQ